MKRELDGVMEKINSKKPKKGCQTPRSTVAARPNYYEYMDT